MDSRYIIERLSNNKIVFANHLQNISREEYMWKPNETKWCLLELVCHLVDEEIEDFRARVNHTLNEPEAPLKSIDPVGWVTKRKYLEQNYEKKLDTFFEERKGSVKWLKTLSDPKWENALFHPDLGTMSAKKFLYNWLAHDYLHIRQILTIRYNYLKSQSNIDLNYAGKW